MIYYVDIDGTICYGQPYETAVVYEDRVKKINELFDAGHTIVYWTGRGQSTGKDYTQLTVAQLTGWGAKHHQLIMGDKPHFDLYICDKSINDNHFFENVMKHGLAFNEEIDDLDYEQWK